MTTIPTITRLLDNLLDELQSSDDPSFTTPQIDLLEKRLFEIQELFHEAVSPAKRRDPHESESNGGNAMTDSSEMTNVQRAARAERILKRYQSGDEDLQTCLADVLTDAMHWCDSTSLDFQAISGQAFRYYIEELGEPPVVRDVPQSLASVIHRLLATRRQIAHIWSIEDVQSQCDWLTDEQAWEVLQSVKRHVDACVGINWDVINHVVHDLYPQSPSTHPKGN